MKHSEGITEFLTITLIVLPEGTLLLRSVEFIAPTCRARFSFGQEATLDQVLTEPARRAMESLTERIVKQRGMLSLPDVTIELAGLVLGDCRIVATDAREGGAQVLIRFSEFTGDILALFAEGSEIHRRVVSKTETDDVSMRLFEQAYLPLNDVAEYIISLEKDLRDDQIGDALIGLARRIKTLDGFADAKRLSPRPSRPMLH